MSKKASKPTADDTALEAMTTEQLIAALEAEKSKTAKLEKTNTEQAELVDELSKAVTTAGKGGKQKVTVKHETDTYEVNCKSFTFEGKIVTAEALAKDKGLIAKLVEIKSGHLVLVG